MGKSQPLMVKCADCGFLSVMSQHNGFYLEADIFYRSEGHQGFQNEGTYLEPHCAIHYQDIHSEPLVADGFFVQLANPGGGLLRWRVRTKMSWSEQYWILLRNFALVMDSIHISIAQMWLEMLA